MICRNICHSIFFVVQLTFFFADVKWKGGTPKDRYQSKQNFKIVWCAFECTTLDLGLRQNCSFDQSEIVSLKKWRSDMETAHCRRRGRGSNSAIYVATRKWGSNFFIGLHQPQYCRFRHTKSTSGLNKQLINAPSLSCFYIKQSKTFFMGNVFVVWYNKSVKIVPGTVVVPLRALVMRGGGGSKLYIWIFSLISENLSFRASTQFDDLIQSFQQHICVSFARRKRSSVQ